MAWIAGTTNEPARLVNKFPMKTMYLLPVSEAGGGPRQSAVTTSHGNSFALVAVKLKSPRW